MQAGATAFGPKAEISKHGLFVILAATGIALLGTPLASPAMPEIARVFAENAQNEPFAIAILQAISILPGDPTVIFLVKFILLSIPALFIILAAPLVGWLSDTIGRKRLLNISLVIFGVSGASGYFAEDHRLQPASQSDTFCPWPTPRLRYWSCNGCCYCRTSAVTPGRIALMPSVSGQDGNRASAGN